MMLIICEHDRRLLSESFVSLEATPSESMPQRTEKSDCQVWARRGAGWEEGRGSFPVAHSKRHHSNCRRPGNRGHGGGPELERLFVAEFT